MKITWLGQAGLLFETEKLRVIVDPYLSDSVGKVNPASARRVPVEEAYLRLKPEVLLFTHNHLDHFDPETADVYLAMEGDMTVLCPGSVWPEARKRGGGKNYVLFDIGTTWTEGDVRFTAVPAAHSDDHAIGVLLEDLTDGKVYYITGDTLYSERIFPALPNRIDAVFLPINGVGNNMNMTDAAAFARRTGAARVVPLHWGLFDSLDPAAFPVENKVIPAFFREIEL